MKKVLITRYGGLGDVAPVLVAAKQFKAKHPDYYIDIALRCDGPVIQSDLCDGIPWINKAMDIIQIGPWGTRCIKYKHGLRDLQSVYKEYDEVIDYMYIIENNSTCRNNEIKAPQDFWKPTRNSNWVNWYDLHLSWANIDPTSVSDSDKNPEFFITEEEDEKYKNIFKDYQKVVLLNPYASSCARTWYSHRFDELVNMLIKRDGHLVGVWNQQENKWVFVNKDGFVNIDIDESSPIRKTMIYINYADLYISADSGFAHVAEGLGKRHIVMYSTVPWWTRAKYYQHQVPVDPGKNNPEYYTFTLGAGDPLRMADGEAAFSSREKKMVEMQRSGVPSEKAAKELDTDVMGLNIEFESLMKKRQSFERQQSKALSSISAEDVFKIAKELLR